MNGAKQWHVHRVYLMQNHRFVCKFNKRLGDTESQWPQASTKASNKNKCLHTENVMLLQKVSLRISVELTICYLKTK